jgi:hypothetical protein
MTSPRLPDVLDILLYQEEEMRNIVAENADSRQLDGVQANIVSHVRQVARTGDLALAVSTEKTIIEGDLARYANSKAMESSLKTALQEFNAIELHLGIVDDPSRYAQVDAVHALPRNRKNGLPFDEARQAFASHIARLGNLDKSRLSDTEKALVDARKANMQQAAKLYALRQAKALGVGLQVLQGEGE